MKQLILDLAWEPLPPFAGFMSGENVAAVVQLREQAWPGPPIYLWGPAGCGKTQLLHELQSRAACEGRSAQWFDASTPTPWVLDDHTALVLLDDAEEWSAAQQHSAFTLFVEAASRVSIPVPVPVPVPVQGHTPHAAVGARLGVQIAASGRLPPVDLALREDLRTRLGWGTVHAIRPLAEGDTRVALHEEARRHGIDLRDDVLDYLLNRFARDLKSLMHILHRLDGFALAEKRTVGVTLLKRMLDEESAPVRDPRDA